MYKTMGVLFLWVDDHDFSCWSEDCQADSEDTDVIFCPSSIQQVAGGNHSSCGSLQMGFSKYFSFEQQLFHYFLLNV